MSSTISCVVSRKNSRSSTSFHSPKKPAPGRMSYGRRSERLPHSKGDASTCEFPFETCSAKGRGRRSERLNSVTVVIEAVMFQVDGQCGARIGHHCPVSPAANSGRSRGVRGRVRRCKTERIGAADPLSAGTLEGSVGMHVLLGRMVLAFAPSDSVWLMMKV